MHRACWRSLRNRRIRSDASTWPTSSSAFPLTSRQNFVEALQFVFVCEVDLDASALAFAQDAEVRGAQYHFKPVFGGAGIGIDALRRGRRGRGGFVPDHGL